MLALIEMVRDLPGGQGLYSSFALTGSLIATLSISTRLVATLTTYTVIMPFLKFRG